MRNALVNWKRGYVDGLTSTIAFVVAMALGTGVAWAVAKSDVYQPLALAQSAGHTLGYNAATSTWTITSNFCVPVEAANTGFSTECKSHTFTADAAAKTRIETLVTTDIIPAFKTQHGYR